MNTKIFKRIVAGAMLLMMTLAMAGCGAGTQNNSEDASLGKDAEEIKSTIFCFSGTDVNGNPVDTAQIFSENKITVVNVWASWCGPCVGEIPELQKMNEELEKKDCQVVGMLSDGEDPQGLSDALEILESAGVDYLNMVFSEKKAAIMEINAIPATYFVDSDGKIIGEPIVGAMPEAYSQRVDELLSEM